MEIQQKILELIFPKGVFTWFVLTDGTINNEDIQITLEEKDDPPFCTVCEVVELNVTDTILNAAAAVTDILPFMISVPAFENVTAPAEMVKLAQLFCPVRLHVTANVPPELLSKTTLSVINGYPAPPAPPLDVAQCVGVPLFQRPAPPTQ